MKLFFDENLSPALVSRLRQLYPGSSHVRSAQLVGQADHQIWNYCQKNGFIIVSKDTDFRERSFAEGAPPKIIWLDVGNAGTTKIVNLLQREHQRITRFASQTDSSLLILSLYRNAI